MTIKNAERIVFLMKERDSYKNLDSKIRSLHKDKKIDELANLALEISKELVNYSEKQINEL